MIYLDNAATTLIKPPTVRRAVTATMTAAASPGRGAYKAAMLAAQTVQSARETAARLFNVQSPEQVVFTANATHALNIAIASLAGSGTKTVISGFEHNSVVRPLNAIGADVAVAGRRLFDPADTLKDFKRLLPGAELCVCTYVSNAFGYILPIYEISELCAKNRVPLIVDASQAAGILPIDLAALNAAFIAMPGHKGLYGPQGTGILLCGEEGKPLISGGSGTDSRNALMPDYLPDRLEAGTHNTPGIAGLKMGMEYVRQKGESRILLHERELLKLAVNELSDAKGITVFGGESQAGVLSVCFERLDGETAAEKLGMRDICVRSGLHCAPLAHGSAGTLDEGTVRMSFSSYTTGRELLEACREMRRIASE